MPNAIYPPKWHKVPPPEHPELDRWLLVLVCLLSLLVVLSVLVDLAS